MSKAKSRTFTESVRSGREAAVKRFLLEYKISRKEWNSMTWKDWPKIPVFAEMLLTPLGGHIKFLGTESERVGYAFQNKREGKLFGVIVDAGARQYWTGDVLTSEGDENDAARAAITGLLELAYLRATQPETNREKQDRQEFVEGVLRHQVSE